MDVRSVAPMTYWRAVVGVVALVVGRATAAPACELPQCRCPVAPGGLQVECQCLGDEVSYVLVSWNDFLYLAHFLFLIVALLDTSITCLAFLV